MADLSIVIPVFNEGANFPALWKELSSQIKCDFTAYVVYDFDEDNTVPAVKSIMAQGETRLHLAKNQRGRGVVTAIMTGFDVAADGPVLVVMADLSDDLAQVDRMMELYPQGYYVIAGRRYMKGGRLIGGPFFKQMLSRMAEASPPLVRRLPTP